MDYGVYKVDSVSDEQVNSLVESRESFVLEGISMTKMSEVIEKLEKIMADHGLKSRVFTKGRLGLAAATFVTPVSALAGWATGVGIAAHNIATYDPDYEIAKNKITGTLTITCKRMSKKDAAELDTKIDGLGEKLKNLKI